MDIPLIPIQRDTTSTSSGTRRIMINRFSLSQSLPLGFEVTNREGCLTAGECPCIGQMAIYSTQHVSSKPCHVGGKEIHRSEDCTGYVLSYSAVVRTPLALSHTRNTRSIRSRPCTCRLSFLGCSPGTARLCVCRLLSPLQRARG